MAKLPTWVVILITSVLLFGGLEIASFIKPTQTVADIEKLKILGQISVVQFLGIGILVEILEALFWTVTFVEFAAKLAKTPQLGAVLGIIAYGVIFHWSGGISSILISGWIILVLNVSYVELRKRSHLVAVLSTVAQKIAFIMLAAVSIYSFGV